MRLHSATLAWPLQAALPPARRYLAGNGVCQPGLLKGACISGEIEHAAGVVLRGAYRRCKAASGASTEVSGKSAMKSLEIAPITRACVTSRGGRVA